MMVKRMVQAVLLLGAAALLTGANRVNWDIEVVKTEFGHRVGNPDAKVKVVEFMSYTCPHCAEFAQQGDGAMRVGYVMEGKASIEYRHLIRDPVDLTVGMLVNCGATAKFKGNHDAFILNQGKWIGPLVSASQAQRQRWVAPGGPGRRAIATDFKFYDIMVSRGYTRVQVDQCLGDEATATRLAATSAKEWDRPGVDSTPTFSINGLVMPGTHTWRELEPQIKEFL